MYLSLFCHYSFWEGVKFSMERFCRNIQLIVVSFKAPFLIPNFFLLYNNDLSDDVICNIAILADDTTFYSMHDQASDLWHQLELTAELKLLYETLLAGSGSGLLISILKKLNLLNLTSLLTWVLFMWKCTGPLQNKDHLLRCWNCLSLANWIGALKLPLL